MLLTDGRRVIGGSLVLFAKRGVSTEQLDCTSDKFKDKSPDRALASSSILPFYCLSVLSRSSLQRGPIGSFFSSDKGKATFQGR